MSVFRVRLFVKIRQTQNKKMKRKAASEIHVRFLVNKQLCIVACIAYYNISRSEISYQYFVVLQPMTILFSISELSLLSQNFLDKILAQFKCCFCAWFDQNFLRKSLDTTHSSVGHRSLLTELTRPDR